MTSRRFGFVLALALAACGPNYRYAYDGESAFERCYALDFDQAAAPESRQSCWAAWLQSYSFGAGQDRVEYARNHATQPGAAPATNAQAPQPASAPQTSAATRAQIDARTRTPARTSTAPNPWEHDQFSQGGTAVAAPQPTAATPPPESAPPGDGCSHDCREAWGACGGRCTGSDAACVARCDDGYRECMRGCF